MKPFFRLTQLMIIFSLLFTSCTPTVVPPEFDATDMPTSIPTEIVISPELPPATPTFQASRSSHLLAFPSNPVYIAIDESVSMSRSKGGICDPNLNRYKVPYLLTSLYENWMNISPQVINDLPVTLGYMDNSLEWISTDVINPVVPEDTNLSEMQNEISTRLNEFQTQKIHRGSVPLFKPLFDALALMPGPKDIILISDGDFRVENNSTSQADSIQQNSVEDGMETILEDQNSRIFILLLCTDKLDSQLSWWHGHDNIKVYDFQSSSNLGFVLESLLSDFLSPTNEISVLASTQQSMSLNPRGWKLITSDAEALLPNDVLHFSQGVVPVQLGDNSPLQILWDGNSPIPTPSSNIWPREMDCGNHSLRVMPQEQNGLYLFWWDSQPIHFVPSETEKYFIQNNQATNVSIQMNIEGVVPNSDIPWELLQRCFSPNLRIDGFSPAFSATLSPQQANTPVDGLPEGFDPLPHPLTFTTIQNYATLESAPFGEISRRYYPILRQPFTQNASKQLITPYVGGPEEQYFDFFIPLDFADEQLYPIGEDWKPWLGFSASDGSECLLQENYHNDGPRTGLVKVEMLESGILVKLNKVKDDAQSCEKMTIHWGNWWKDNNVIKDGWNPPKDIKCTLAWQGIGSSMELIVECQECEAK